MIKPHSVEEIINTAKVEEVVGEFVQLKKRGVNLIGLCPFHNEKTPSFTVSPTKNIYKCFGCGKGGNATQFLMEHEHYTFPEALRYLAKKYNIEIEETQVTQESIQERQLLDSLYIVNEFAKDYYHEQLTKTDEGRSIGLSYFKDRGFREATIEKFGLGFAPNADRTFTDAAIQKGYNPELLKKLGLTTSYNKDFFRNRVMFTIRNLSGKVIGFGGRILQKNVKAPKYINSPETEVYNKSRVLYGAFYAKRSIRQLDECIMVEGYTDVISLHQAGIENVVASSGTSLTVEQIRLVKRNTDNMKILYDGDTAGVKAALRGLDLVLEQDMNVKVVLLPEGQDPDSYLQEVGAEDFKKYITDKAKDFILFKASLLMEEVSANPLKKSAMIIDIVGSIAKVPDMIKQSLYVKECASLFQVDEKILYNELNKIAKKAAKEEKRKQKRANSDSSLPSQEPFATPGDNQEATHPPLEGAPPQRKIAFGAEFQEKDIIRILIHAGGNIFDKEQNITVAAYILANIEEVLDDFDNKLYERVARECLQLLVDKKPITQKHFINHWDEDISQLAIDLLSSPDEYSPNWKAMKDIELRTQAMPEDNFKNDTTYSLNMFMLRKVIKRIDSNQKRIEQAQLDKDNDSLIKYLKVHQKLLAIRDSLAAKTNTVVLK